MRRAAWQRTKASRHMVEVTTPWGIVRVKEKVLDGRVASAAPEFDDCAALARREGVPFESVRQAALDAWRKSQ